MTITRRQFITTSAVFGAAGVFASPAMAGQDNLGFVLVGDWGRHGRHHQRHVAKQMGQTAQDINSRFVVSVGDNFYENGVESASDPQWQSSFEEVYTAPSLQTPWNVILGNHDYRGNVQAQLDYAKQSSRWRIPARYYNEVVKLPDGAKAAFFYLDTSPFIKKYYGSRVQVEGQDTKAQLDWLEAGLAASDAAWNIVIGHHPIYTAHAPEEGHDHDQPDLVARLNPILQKHAVPLYVCGHDHVQQAVKINDISYVCTGAGSETYQPGPAIRGGFISGAHGFMAVRLSGARLDYALIDETGASLYAQSIIRV